MAQIHATMHACDDSASTSGVAFSALQGCAWVRYTGLREISTYGFLVISMCVRQKYLVAEPFTSAFSKRNYVKNTIICTLSVFMPLILKLHQVLLV
jgi:hypothetical protein